jgi:hypothetical protein
MQTRFLLPFLGGILGILFVRGPDTSTLESFGAMLIGAVAGWGIYWFTSRNSRKGGI